MRKKFLIAMTGVIMIPFFEVRAEGACDCGVAGHESECCWEINNGVLHIYSAPGVTSADMKNYTYTELGTSSEYPNRYQSSAPWAGKSVTSVQIDDGISSIGRCAFIGESKITNVSGMNGVSSIGSNAFNRTSGITSLTIPDSVTTIGATAFWHMTSLKELSLPDTLTTIGNRPFGRLGEAEGIYIPNDSVETLIVSADTLSKYLNALGGLRVDANIHCISGDCQSVLANWDATQGTNYSSQTSYSGHVKMPDGSTRITDLQGNVIGYKGKRIYTIEEANEVAGPVNRVTIRYK